MPITINGSGTVTGLSVGGLPDGSINNADLATDAVSTSKLLNGAVTTAKLGSAEASGLCKAWVNFNGIGTVAIRASYNVSSITDNGTGNYTVNFTTAMADANYSAVFANGNDSTGNTGIRGFNAVSTQITPTVNAIRCSSWSGAPRTLEDSAFLYVAIFR